MKGIMGSMNDAGAERDEICMSECGFGNESAFFLRNIDDFDWLVWYNSIITVKNECEFV